MKRRTITRLFAVLLAAQLALGGSITALADSAEPPAEGGAQESVTTELTEKQRYVPIDQIISSKADSSEVGYGPEKAVDGDLGSIWHTPWGENPPKFPHWLQVEFKEPQLIDSLVYFARNGDTNLFVTEYEVQVSTTGDEADLETVTAGEWTPEGPSATAAFEPTEAILVRFIAKAWNGRHETGVADYVSVAELKFGLSDSVPGALNGEINRMLACVDRVSAYAVGGVGAGEHQFDQASYDALLACRDTLAGLLDSAKVTEIYAAVDAAQAAIDLLLNSNKQDGEATVAVLSKSGMRVEADTENEGYAAYNVLDGSTATMWHSQYSPESTPLPHNLYLDLGRSVMLGTVTITPRQDAWSGIITQGKIYIGDDPENLTEATAIEGVTDSSPNAIDMGYRQGRYIRIEVIGTNSGNTAIAELDVETYDRGYATLMDAYDRGLQFFRNAETGDDIGQYTQAVMNEYRLQMEEYESILNEDRSNADCYELAEEIEAGRVAFADQVNRYSLEDLRALIAEAGALKEELTNEADQLLLVGAIQAAGATADGPDSTPIEIHEATVVLKNIVDALRLSNVDRRDLSGKWDFYLGMYEPGRTTFEDSVSLPGTLDEMRRGTPNHFRSPTRLSRAYMYTGPATFQSRIMIPNSWQGKAITLYMERSRETRVWVDGTEITAHDTNNTMSTAQTYDITEGITFGQVNTITIVVDNSYPTTPAAAILRSSTATDETQTNWNGIVGRFELQITPEVRIDDLRIYPNQDLESVSVQADIKNSSDTEFTGDVTLKAGARSERTVSVTVPAGETVTAELSDYAMGDNVQLWSEFGQNLYTMTAALPNDHTVTERFGMRVFGVDPETKQLTNNGDKIFLRGEANCAVFPLTGYAPMDKADWLKFLRTYQSYGVNFVRFHSWCPPEAAFAAADELGMFLQPELSAWDGNMFGDATGKNYYAKEAHAIVKEYANHPSFVMFTYGNELFISDVPFADELMVSLKEQDHTRLYAAASNVGLGYGGPVGEESDFYTGERYGSLPLRGIFGGMAGFINNDHPGTTVNYNESVSDITKNGRAVFGFEVGQFYVFPDVLGSLDGYDGVLAPTNLEIIAERIEDMDIPEETIRQYINASGELSRLGYRTEKEAALRTRHMSGISLLGVQDFPGQNTALVGMMNALGDPKPYDFADPAAFSNVFSPVVALLETEKFCWTNDETFTGKVLLANYGPEDVTGEMFYTLTDGGTVLAEGGLTSITFPQGDTTSAGTIELPLDKVIEPSQLKLTVGLGGITNAYDLWVYPAREQASEDDVYIAEYLDENALYILEKGGKVLLSPKASKETLPESMAGTFTPAFWTCQTPDAETIPGTLGLLMDPGHPAFEGFPTEYHSNFQWWPMARKGRPMVLDSLTHADGTKIQPLVQVIDSFISLRTLGLLYEVKVGEGKLMVSSMGLEQLQGKYPEARAMRNAILNYMNSPAFDPDFEAPVEKLQALVKGGGDSERHSVAEEAYGGTIVLGENTGTCWGGYDWRYPDRKQEMNDGLVDLTTGTRSWTDFNMNGSTEYPYDSEITAVLSKEYLVDTVVLPFYEDVGCKAPAKVRVQYLEDGGFKNVNHPSKTSDFVKGNNTITFDPVKTAQVRLIMEHSPNMAIALSEFIVYEKVVPAASITVTSAGEISTVRVDGTLQMAIDCEPVDANRTEVFWYVMDAEGNRTDAATITLAGGLLKALAPGKVTVKAELRSNRAISGEMEITVLPALAETYPVKLTTGANYTVAAAPGSESPVTSGGDFTFTVTPDVGYRKTAPTVKANGITLTAASSAENGYTYTIEGITAAQTVTVEVAADTYTVTFAPGTSGTVEPTSATITYGAVYGELPTPTSSDETKRFDGWFTAAADGTKVTAATVVTATEDHTLYAHWIDKDVSTSPDAGVSGMPEKVRLPYEGADITLAVTAAETYSYQWQSKGGNDAEWADVAENGANASYVIAAAGITLAMDGTQYRCKVTNAEVGKKPVTVEGSAVTLHVEERAEEPSYNPPSGTTTRTEKNPDGSTTRTVTNKKTGAVTETTTYPDGTKIVAVTPKDGETSIEITVPKGKSVVTVTIPTPERPGPGAVAVIVKEDGAREVVKSSVSTEDGLRVTLHESCKLVLMDNGKRFADVTGDHWAFDAVQFAASRELFTGTGADAFSPAAGMTRGMLMTVLARLDGQDTMAGETWYSAGMEWAKERGISDGAAPEADVTRESLAVMLYRYADSPTVDGERRDEVIAPYVDAGSVSDWAQDAMLWAVDAGILTGKEGGTLDPQGEATRAEVAVMLQRLIENAAKN